MKHITIEVSVDNLDKIIELWADCGGTTYITVDELIDILREY